MAVIAPPALAPPRFDCVSAEDLTVRRSTRTADSAALKQNGIVDAHDGPSNHYGYPFCQARFFPGASFPGLQNYEYDRTKYYYLATHLGEGRVFTDEKDCDIFLRLHPCASVVKRMGLYSLGDAIAQWCLGHCHKMPQRHSLRAKPSITTPYDLTTYNHGVQQSRYPRGPACEHEAAVITLSKSRSKPKRVQGTAARTSGVSRAHTAAPATVSRSRTTAAPYKATSSSKTALPRVATATAEVTCGAPRQYIGKTPPCSRPLAANASVSGGGSAAPIAPATPVASGSGTAAAADPCAHAEAAAAKTKDIKFKIVPDLKAALAWHDSHTRSLV
ncbi:hypothetical protein DFH06DRAFT_1346397 [Mycena polygramma]|nr:hypothetical protein DFH06DRAFT_1351010 [Mycena polygramma]KAJ7609370.1 hypothetical protein DFH06DRAFT_1346397 [Mycena polygramma]